MNETLMVSVLFLWLFNLGTLIAFRRVTRILDKQVHAVDILVSDAALKGIRPKTIRGKRLFEDMQNRRW